MSSLYSAVLNKLVTQLTKMKYQFGLPLSDDMIQSVCNQIVYLFHDIRQTTRAIPSLSHIVNGRVVWSEAYQQVIEQFKPRFLAITESVGVVAPQNDQNTFWIGDEGFIAASHFGFPTQKTLPVLLIDSVIYDELRDLFFPHSEDIAVPCVYWAMLSSIYASNIKNGDIKIYTPEDKINSMSFFWNFELPLIRKHVPKARIFIYFLTTDAQQKRADLQKLGEKLTINHESGPMFDLITNEAHWQSSIFEEQIKLTAGFDDGKDTVAYTKLKCMFGFWQQYQSKSNPTKCQDEDVVLIEELQSHHISHDSR